MAVGPLSGIKVIDFSSFVAGPYCAKLLADMGADVLKVETPDGDIARHRGPFKGTEANPELSSVFLYENTNKRGVTLDVEKPTGAEIFKKLISKVDIVVSDKAPGYMEKLGLGYEELKTINPGLIFAAITPFGQDGPYRDFKCYYLNTYHASGAGYVLPANSPDDSREPIKGGGYVGEADVGACTAIAVLAAQFYKNQTGVGQFIDISKQEAMMSLERMNIVRYYELGKSPSRVKINRLRDVSLKCKDGGYVKIVLHPDKQWKGVVKALGYPEWTNDPLWSNHHSREENFEQLTELLQAEANKYDTQELFELVAVEGTACAPICSAEQVFNSEHTKAREYYVEIDHPVAGKLMYPGLPFKQSEGSVTDNFGAPMLGQDNEAVYGDLGYSKKDLVKLRESGVI